MQRRLGFLTLFIILGVVAPFSAGAGYDPEAPLRVKRVEFCKDKPRGLGNFELKEENEFKKGDNQIYIYVEVDNCRSKKDGQYYHIRLAMDMDIYYEDGICIYSEEETNTFDYQSRRKDTDAYLWANIDASYLKEGEYKVEMVIRDLNSDKESFALARFRR